MLPDVVFLPDFVIYRFFMKLFKTNNLETVTYCRMQYCPVLSWKKEVMFSLENIGCAVTFLYTGS